MTGNDPKQALTPDVAAEHEGTAKVPPWELVEVGRYRPRRIRGSYRGRELG
jgi:hypothetical protein